MGEWPMLRQREPRQYDQGHLQFIRSQPCCICGDNVSVEAAHLRVGSINDDKPHTGMGEKPSDSKWVLPLCGRHHREQHAAGSEMAWWSSYGIDPFALAMHYQMRPR
jgi:hypothetical protein